MIQKNETILEIHNLSVSFRMYESGLEQKELKVISDLHLTVRPGEIVAIAGSSGSRFGHSGHPAGECDRERSPTL